MYTKEHGSEKAIGITVKKISPTVSFDLTFSGTQAGMGIAKDLGNDWRAGIGVATEYDKWDPDVFAYLMKSFNF